MSINKLAKMAQAIAYLALIMSLSIPPTEAESNTGDLQSEQPSADTPQPEPSLHSEDTPKKSMLTGGVTRDARLEQPSVTGQSASLTMDEAKSKDLSDLQRAARNPRRLLFLLNGQRQGFVDLSAPPRLSSEDFRKMEYGVIGLDAMVSLNESDIVGPTITTLYPTCPAANAGMRIGDVIVKANDHVFQRGEGQRVLWKVVAGKAGTPVDVTVLRKGEEITFHLNRMNIEDIENDRIRRVYETLLSKIGPPTNE